MRLKPSLLLGLLALAAILIVTTALRSLHRQREKIAATPPAQPAMVANPAGGVIQFYGHNLLLRQGPALKIYIPWLRGQLVATHPGETPWLDDHGSFLLQVQRGVVRLQLSDLSYFLSSNTIRHAPFSHVTLAIKQGQLVMHATVRKLIPLRTVLTGTLRPAGGNVVAFRVTKISVLSMPLHGLLHAFHLTLGDFFQSHATGIRVAGDTVYFNAETLPPAPQLNGDITSITLTHDPLGPAIETIYGDAHDDAAREEQWRDFLQLEGGTLRFGRLTMRNVDLILIDAASKDPWFDLDLPHYQTQLVYGITRVTPQAGLQIFMPSLNQLPHSQPSAIITREWLQNRYAPALPSAPVH